ncbi:MAG: family 1 glycosylhydrolase, partial [Betaproteobacteria bacterium]
MISSPLPTASEQRVIGRREFLALGAAGAAGTLTNPVLAQAGDLGDRFVWGAATSAYQIEGAPTRMGGGASVWDTFCRRKGAVRDESNGDVAVDHVNRFREDIALMRDLGIRAYRFSISWPRVLPDGVGKVNAPGLDFYDRLVDALGTAGIEPWVTLFHWDYPEALYKRGGWLKDDSPDWFAQYTTVVAKRLSDRVTHWMTFNEPEIFIILGHQLGIHAPGDKLGWSEILRISHHVLLAHGL